MKTYPSIPHSAKAPRDEDCYIFVKYDGSNLRFEWSKKRGWYKFGTRKTMFDESHPIYGTAVELFRQRYADGIDQVVRKSKVFQGAQNLVVFCEWFGAKTFAGHHKPDDPKNLVLFDVNPHKKGVLGPKQFLDEFGHLEIAELLDRRSIDDEFIASVRNEEFTCTSQYAIANEVPEGVICKGSSGHNLWMCKIKTQRYHELLKVNLGANWTQYWE